MEEWKFYKSFRCGRSKEPNREIWVSNYGRTKINGVIRDNPQKAGTERIYRVVAELFIPNPDNKTQVDHIDTDRTNNRVDNLRWVTPKENMNNTITKKHCKEAMFKRIDEGIYLEHYNSMKGRTPWNKGLTSEIDSRIRSGYKLKHSTIEKMRVSARNRKKNK